MTDTAAAVQRIGRFLEAWDRHSHADDIIYGIGAFVDEDDTRDLLASDLRLLLEAHDGT